MATTKAPSGLTIAREGNSFKFSWKISDSDYNNGQEYNYYFSPEMNGKWAKQGVGPQDTSKTAWFTPANYYPHTNRRMNYVKFRVRGNRAAYTQNNSTVDPGWSNWTEKQLDIAVPNKPYDVAFTQDSELANVGSFSWKVNADTNARQIFRRVQWQTALVKGTAEPKWSSRDLHFATGVSYNSEGSQSITETYSPTMNQTYTRWFRIRSQGPRGDSDWRVAKHVWAIPNKPYYTGGDAVTDTRNLSTNITVQFNVYQSNGEKPVNSVDIDYSFATPDRNLAFPESGTWTTATTVRDTADPRQTVQFNVNEVMQLDQCLYVRICSKYDRQATYGNIILFKKGNLRPPTINNIVVNTESSIADISATNNSSVPDSFLAIYYTDSLNKARVIGIIPSGQSSISSLPFPYNPDAANPYFSIRACQGKYSVERTDGGVTYYTLNTAMVSSVVREGGAVPKVPTINVENSDVENVAFVHWGWTWDLAEGITISWSDDPHAWESIDSPETHDVKRIDSSVLYVTGLDIAKTYYFRARFFNETLNSISEWSDPIEFVPSSIPDPPVLSLSSNLIFVNGTVEANWTYSSEDGLPQGGFQIAIVTLDSDGNIDTAIPYAMAPYGTTSKTIWQNYFTNMPPGTTINLAVRVKPQTKDLMAERWSDWSNIVSLTCVYPMTVEISDTSLVETTVESNTYLTLDEMPLSVTVTGAGEGGVTSVYILRASDYHVDRPDETDFDGYEGEVIAYRTQIGEAEMAFNLEDLYGSFDDGAAYVLKAIVSDIYGQTAEASLTFDVGWSHQPVVPEVTVNCYTTSMAAAILVSTPQGYLPGDTFDVYRLSSDRPELIIQNGEYGTTYVDPYPAFNAGSGYRVVSKTASGDYITSANTFAWTDVYDPFIKYYRLVIDFAAQRAILPYNLTFDNTWTKDFTRTEYLGGAVVGDWNPQVTKDISVSTVLIPDQDEDAIELAHRLAEYPGVCHVRTPQGNSFSADVQLTESITFDGLVYDYNLEIKKVDGQSLDGVTLEEWEQEHGPLA